MASGDTLLEHGPLTYEPPASNYPQIGNLNNHPTLDFDATTKETAYFSAVLPRNYAGGGITVDVFWITAATTGNVVWLAAVERMDAATALSADSFAADQSATTASPGVANETQTSSVALTNAQIDGLLAGEPFRLRVARDAANASDTAASDARIIAIQIRET